MEEEATDVNEQGSATQPVEPVTQDDGFAVPEAYKDAGWASNIKSVNDLWEQHANAQKLIGKKTIGIPSADSSEAEIAEFYSHLRPQEAKDYEIDLGDDTEEFQKVFYENGISARQAKAITEAYKENVRRASEGLFSEENFKAVMHDTLGDDYKEKIEKVNGFLKQYGKKSALAEIDQLPNETLGLLYGLINLTMDKYAVKELGSVGSDGTASAPKDLGEYMKKMQELDNDPFVTQEKRDALRREYGIIK